MKSGPNVELEVGTGWLHGARKRCCSTGGFHRTTFQALISACSHFGAKPCCSGPPSATCCAPEQAGLEKELCSGFPVHCSCFLTPLQNHPSDLSHGLWASQGCCRSHLPRAGHAGRVSGGQGWPGSPSHPPGCELTALISLPEGL